MEELKLSTPVEMPEIKLEIVDPLCLYSNGVEVGRLEIRDKKLIFKGDVDKAAEEFFLCVKCHVEDYILMNCQ